MTNRDTSKETREQAEIRVGWRMSGIGLEVSSQVAAGLLLGWLFDKWQGTRPTGMTVGAIVGIIVAMWSLIRGSLKLNRELERQHPSKGTAKPIPYEDEESDDEDDNW